MIQHDPYGPMLAELRAINDSDDEAIFCESLRQLQPYVENLRRQYRCSPSNVDFSCPHIRAAYFLAYYPHYIEPLYRILLQSIEKGVGELLNQPRLRVCFIGAGPAPEALGLVAFLQAHCPEATCVTGYLLDKYVDGWRFGQELTRYHLAPHYWPNGKLVLRPVAFDFLNESFLEDPFADRAIKHAHLLVMQNCLNDQLQNPEQALEMVMRIFRLAPLGALFVICDLNFDLVRDLMRRIQEMVVAEKIGQILLPVKEKHEWVSSSIILPGIVKEQLLNGTGLLVPKMYTRYYSSVMQRAELEDELPF